MALMKPAAVDVEAEREAEDDDEVIRSIIDRAYIRINTVKTFLKIWIVDISIFNPFNCVHLKGRN